MVVFMSCLKGLTESVHIWVSSKSDPFSCDLKRQNQPFDRLQFEVDGKFYIEFDYF